LVPESWLSPPPALLPSLVEIRIDLSYVVLRKQRNGKKNPPYHTAPNGHRHSASSGSLPASRRRRAITPCGGTSPISTRRIAVPLSVCDQRSF
jgi:hypothetical protein